MKWTGGWTPYVNSVMRLLKGADVRMKVCIDGYIFALQGYGGVRRYVTELLRHLPGEVELCLVLPPGLKKEDICSRQVKVIRHNPWRFRGAEWWKPVERALTKLRVALFRPDILHLCYYESLIFGPRPARMSQMVLTVYDFIWQSRPQEFADADRSIAIQMRAIHQASAVICISEATQSELQKFCRFEAVPLRVIPLGGFGDVVTTGGSKPCLPNEGQRFFLFVGGRNKYKGFHTLLRALEIVLRQVPDVFLVATGARPTDEETEVISQSGSKDRVKFIGGVDEEKMVQLYRSALALVYPSEHEGFGIPLVEAMQTGTPIIACRNSSIPEVVGNAGLLVETGNEHELAAAMQTIASDERLRCRLKELGLKRAALFEWAKTATATIDFYREVASNAPILVQ